MKKRASGLKGKRRINFSIVEPRAKKVSLVADFNQWQPDKHPMKKGKHDEWTKTVYLLPGTYEYKFWVDGRWQIDDQNKNRCRNNFGSRNNLINIDPN